MKIYFLANQVYQLSYAKPIYQRLGGTFMVSNYRKLAKFKWHLWQGLTTSDGLIGEKKPRVIKHDIKNLFNLKGVILSQSNTRIICRNGHATTIFVGHGTGDKKYGGNPEILRSYDYHFISGPKHLTKLEDVGIRIPESRQIPIGNPRFDNYLNCVHKKKYYFQYKGVRDNSRPTILYAPTWKWGGGTLRKLIYRLGRDLSKNYNLIVRPHHFDTHLLPWLKSWVKIKGLQNIYFSNPNDLIYEDTMDVFASSDLLISDTSSILYEYLITGNPIIQIRNKEKDLHTMPPEMNISGKADIYDPATEDDICDKVRWNLDKQPFREEYKTLLSNCFYLNNGHCTDKAVDFLRRLS